MCFLEIPVSINYNQTMWSMTVDQCEFENQIDPVYLGHVCHHRAGDISINYYVYNSIFIFGLNEITYMPVNVCFYIPL